MKTRILLLLFLTFANLQAQTTGEAAVAPAQVAKANNWQNWAFVASAMATAAGAVVLVAINDGHDAPAH